MKRVLYSGVFLRACIKKFKIFLLSCANTISLSYARVCIHIRVCVSATWDMLYSILNKGGLEGRDGDGSFEDVRDEEVFESMEG